MATIARNYVGVAHTISGNSPRVVYMEEGVPTWTIHLGAKALGLSGTGYFKRGALLYLNGTGGLDVMTSGGDAAGSVDPSTGFDNANNRLVGFALEDGTGGIQNEVAILAAVPDTIFYGNVGSSTSAATATISRMNSTVPEGIPSGAAGGSLNSSVFYVNVTASLGGSFLKLVGKHSADAFGDTYGRVLFTFLQDTTIWD